MGELIRTDNHGRVILAGHPDLTYFLHEEPDGVLVLEPVIVMSGAQAAYFALPTGDLRSHRRVLRRPVHRGEAHLSAAVTVPVESADDNLEALHRPYATHIRPTQAPDRYRRARPLVADCPPLHVT
ncbi:hypothetical protein [Mycobacterium servetii]|uniref:Uncharacterized protein n=1 Tax=Mycobacterium servetii TaxID=3237418 RepID=A0ABV4C9A3_9MYCO